MEIPDQRAAGEGDIGFGLFMELGLIVKPALEARVVGIPPHGLGLLQLGLQLGLLWLGCCGGYCGGYRVSRSRDPPGPALSSVSCRIVLSTRRRSEKNTCTYLKSTTDEDIVRRRDVLCGVAGGRLPFCTLWDHPLLGNSTLITCSDLEIRAHAFAGSANA